MADSAKSLPEWQQYPTFAEFLTDPAKAQELKLRAFRSCEQFDQLLRTGEPAQKEAAQQALNAYGTALKLLEDARAEYTRQLNP